MKKNTEQVFEPVNRNWFNHKKIIKDYNIIGLTKKERLKETQKKEFLNKNFEWFLMGSFIVIGLFFTVTFALIYDKTPLLINESLYGDENFWASLIVNLHTSLLDFIVYSVILYFLIEMNRKKKKIAEYHENLENARGWKHAHATSTILANVKFLLRYGIQNVDLKDCYFKGHYIRGEFENADFSSSEFTDMKANGWKAKNCYMNQTSILGTRFRRSQFIGGRIENTIFGDCDTQGLRFENVSLARSSFVDCKLLKAFFIECNLENVSFVGADLTRATMLNCKNVNLENIMRCEKISKVTFDDELERRMIEFLPPDHELRIELEKSQEYKKKST